MLDAETLFLLNLTSEVIANALLGVSCQAGRVLWTHVSKSACTSSVKRIIITPDVPDLAGRVFTHGTLACGRLRQIRGWSDDGPKEGGPTSQDHAFFWGGGEIQIHKLKGAGLARLMNLIESSSVLKILK